MRFDNAVVARVGSSIMGQNDSASNASNTDPDQTHATRVAPAHVPDMELKSVTPAETRSELTVLSGLGAVSKIWDGYELLEVIRQSGMGVIYRARQVAIGRIVALKTIRPELISDRRYLHRFEREVRAQAQLDHPNIVKIFDICLERTPPYYTMSFVRGGDLARRRADYRDPRNAAAFMAKVALAVQHAHSHGTVHRDLKPSNILIGETGEPFVGDFGLAKRVGAELELTQMGEAVGTVPYMAPEQIDGQRDVGCASDIWALGLVLYELLAGARPFQGDSSEEIKRQICRVPAPPLGYLRKGIDPRLESIVSRCLQKRPEQRYESAGLLAHDLDAWLSGRELTRQPAGSFWRRARIRRLLKMGLILGITVIVAGIAASQWNRFNRSFAPVVKDLSAGRTLHLLGSEGRPEWLTWFGSPPIFKGSESEPFEFRSEDRSMVEIVRNTAADRYSFTSEVCHLGSDHVDGEIGIYLGRQHGSAHEVCWVIAFNESDAENLPAADEQRQANRNLVRFKILVLPRYGKGQTVQEEIARLPFDSRGKEWRRLRIDVTGRQLRITWAGQSFEPIDMASASVKYRRWLHDVAHVQDVSAEPDWRGGLGLYVAHGSAAFRNTELAPLGSE
jgi:serine/threonine protein kinase